ncbi:hypothetical protein ACIQWA_06785 [Kitasatospora sp. NPDC098652]|uniref:hypothetical protein n=1 Tax=Kitasatospora sp. NPDC098652 TaxID=3364095 RepID=UPI0038255765
MRTWTIRQWTAAALGAIGAGLAIGVPTGIIKTSLYTRMTPVLWWNYPAWAASAALEGLLLATYMSGRAFGRRLAGEPAQPRSGRALAAGLLSAFAVGCPICNKLVVMALGVSGALSYFAPAQPALALLSLGLLGHALIRRLRTANACPAPTL